MIERRPIFGLAKPYYVPTYEDRFKIITKNKLLVNLDAPPGLIHEKQQIDYNNGKGWVEVDKKNERIFVNGRKVVFYLHENQRKKTAVAFGDDIFNEMLNKELSFLHPNIMFALLENNQFYFERNELDQLRENNEMMWQNVEPRIFFWGAVFSCIDHMAPKRDYVYYMHYRPTRRDRTRRYLIGSHWDWGMEHLSRSWWPMWAAAVLE